MVAVKVSVVVPVQDTDTVVGAVSTATATEPKSGGMRRLKACLRGTADARRTAGPLNREVIVWVGGGR